MRRCALVWRWGCACCRSAINTPRRSRSRTRPLALATATVGAVLHFVPHALPLLAPTKRPPALHAGLFRQLVFLAHGHVALEPVRTWAGRRLRPSMSCHVERCGADAIAGTKLSAADSPCATQPCFAAPHRNRHLCSHAQTGTAGLPSAIQKRAECVPSPVHGRRNRKAPGKGAHPRRVTCGAISPLVPQAPRG